METSTIPTDGGLLGDLEDTGKRKGMAEIVNGVERDENDVTVTIGPGETGMEERVNGVERKENDVAVEIGSSETACNSVTEVSSQSSGVSERINNIRNMVEKSADQSWKKRLVARGLYNLGNTCYMNAVLQCLWIASSRMKKSTHVTKPLVEEFWKLVKRLSSNGRRAVAPTEFKHSLLSGWPQFAGGGQHDAHEFLVVMLDQLALCDGNFTGSVSTTSTCGSCNYQSVTKENFRCLMVDIPTSHTRPSVRNCVEQTFAEAESIEDWNCHHGCGTLGTTGKREYGISCLPSLLFIQLKRFVVTKNGVVKNRAVVDLSNCELVLGGMRYALVGIVHHAGSLSSGHYTATIKVNGRWKTCNDTRVMDAGEVQRKSGTAYLLTYLRVSESMVSSDQGCLAPSLPNSIME